MNKTILVGNLTRDPELLQTPNGNSICKFGIAVNRRYANADGEYEADFIEIVTWRSLAENCGKYLSKGSKIAVCGAIQTRSYDDKNGNRRYVTEVVADDVEFIRTEKPEQKAEKPAEPKQIRLSDLKPVEDDNLPF